jgi:hypothetical protein
VKISLSNPERPDIEAQSIDATINTGARSSLVSRSLQERLALPKITEAGGHPRTPAKDAAQETRTYACVEYSGARSVIELLVSDTAENLVLSQAALVAMGLEFDPFTGIPVLHA